MLELGPSPVLVLVLAALHAGGGLIALTLPLAWIWRVALLGAVGASLYRALALHGVRRAPGAVVALAFGDEARCALYRRGAGRWEAGRVVDCRVQARLVLLVVRSDERRRASRVVIPADAVAPEPFRRLRARLRLGGAAA